MRFSFSALLLFAIRDFFVLSVILFSESYFSMFSSASIHLGSGLLL